MVSGSNALSGGRRDCIGIASPLAGGTLQQNRPLVGFKTGHWLGNRPVPDRALAALQRPARGVISKKPRQRGGASGRGLQVPSCGTRACGHRGGS
jgi:hypothetical protein